MTQRHNSNYGNREMSLLALLWSISAPLMPAVPRYAAFLGKGSALNSAELVRSLVTVLQYAPSLQEAGNLPSSFKRPVGLSACPGKDPHDPHRHPYPLQQALVGLKWQMWDHNTAA